MPVINTTTKALDTLTSDINIIPCNKPNIVAWIKFPILKLNCFESTFVKNPLNRISSDSPICKKEKIKAGINALTPFPVNWDVAKSASLTSRGTIRNKL